MTNQQSTRTPATSPAEPRNHNQFQQPHHGSTTSSATTLVDPFRTPGRSDTGSTIASSATATSQTSQASQISQRTSPTHHENQANKDVAMSPQQAELLRYKGTYTDSGRHSDDWLFGGWSFTNTVKGAWRKVSGGGNEG